MNGRHSGSTAWFGFCGWWTLTIWSIVWCLCSPSLWAAGTVNVDDFELPPGKSVTIEFEVTITNPPSGGATQVCNQGQTTSLSFAGTQNTNDPDTAPPNDPTCTQLLLQADLGITKTDSQASDVPGTGITYIIVATNYGPSIVTDAAVTDTFPAALTGCTWNSVGSLGVSGNDPGPTAGNINDTGITIPVNGTVTYTVNCTIDPSAPAGILSNSAAVASVAFFDPGPNPNNATDNTTLTPEADLTVSKADSADPVNAASGFSYTLNVTNNGPSTATMVQVVDTLPAGVVYGSFSGTGWGCAEAPVGTITCNRATLLPGAAPTITLNVTAPNEGGAIINNVSASSGVTDPLPGNNADTETTQITPIVDLTISKADSADPVGAGLPFSYTLIVSNNGPWSMSCLRALPTPGSPARVGAAWRLRWGRSLVHALPLP
jgi:uncharacterized repeat protein (TIGR01451 family)